MIEFPEIILASASPRRAEILRTVGWPFEALPVDVDETRHNGENAIDYVQRLAREKAKAAAARKPALMILAADTTVTIDDHILEKPTDESDAARMLQLLNNRWHRVLTGIAIINPDMSRTIVAHEETEVKFAAMSDEEIDWYVKTGEPMDKAGAYAIQGLGARFIEEIKGDFFNVVGLPIRLVYEVFVESLASSA
ncbi:MAG TPA: Maf family protein [Pyrinomonadaceae bacterium]|jgi:septum formation protein|nr:Maf family protein [Pyrinomonadaceae bacterium]